MVPKRIKILAHRQIITRVNRLLGYDTSQNKEAIHLKRLIKKNWPPYLADVGAHDGKYLSNSYPFIKTGWHAILLEPLPKAFIDLSTRYANNPQVKCINQACSNTIGPQKFFFGIDGDFGAMSTLCTDSNQWFNRNRSKDFIYVDVDTLTNILTEHNFPKDFSLLLIDTEGMDYEVLQVT